MPQTVLQSLKQFFFVQRLEKLESLFYKYRFSEDWVRQFQLNDR